MYGELRSGGRSAGRLRLRVPPEVGGVVAAAAADLRGDPGPLRVWCRDRYAALHRAVVAAGFDAVTADEAVSHLLVQAWETARSDRQIENELGWICVVIVHGAAAARRRRWRTERLHCALGEHVRRRSGIESSRALELREQIVLAATRLPPPYGHVAILRGVRGYVEPEIAAWLRSWRELGPDQCRKIHRRTFAMLSAVLQGTDPRALWPQRYSKKNLWIGAPLPPLVTLLS